LRRRPEHGCWTGVRMGNRSTVDWRERSPRPGWDITYTGIGARIATQSDARNRPTSGGHATRLRAAHVARYRRSRRWSRADDFTTDDPAASLVLDGPSYPAARFKSRVSPLLREAIGDVRATRSRDPLPLRPRITRSSTLTLRSNSIRPGRFPSGTSSRPSTRVSHHGSSLRCPSKGCWGAPETMVSLIGSTSCSSRHGATSRS
jgi:hypothetical protein